MLTRRSLLLLAPSAMVMYAIPSQAGRAEETAAGILWKGEHLRRISRVEQEALPPAMRAFCGQSLATLIPGISPFLFDQFNAVGFMMDEYCLPNGRLILNLSDGRAGIDSVVVTDAQGSASILAAALLIQLYPDGGVVEHFITSNGIRYEEHLPSEWDYSLVILYPRGSVPDLNLTSDLTKWAKAQARGRVRFVRLDRKLLLKRFVRVLAD